MTTLELRGRALEALGCFVDRKPEPPVWEKRKILVYGAGGFGRDLAKALLAQGKGNLLGFIDQKGVGQTVVQELSAHPLESEMTKRWMGDNPVVMIGVYNGSASLRAIKAMLVRYGFPTVVTPMEAYLHLSTELGWRYWMGTPPDYASADTEIEKAFTLWADEESQRQFLETLLFRLEFDLELAIPPADHSMQYGEPSLPSWETPLRMVDGGAYTGDTIQNMMGHGHQFAAIHAFEPDLANFKQLQTAVSGWPRKTEVTLWPCGLWSSTRRMSFSAGEGTSSKLTSSGTSSVSVVALDDVLHGIPINLIKMDIEGAEPEALSGSRRLIEEYRPGLAICLYHYPCHLWSIPQLVAQLSVNYSLYYRTHQHNTFETVLYAFPSKR